MGKIIKKVFIIVFFMSISIFFMINNKVYAGNLTNITRIYFYSEVTKDVGAGDCILLENYDQNGVKHYGLIDAGNKRDENGKVVTSVKNFLKKHGVTKLEFFMVTHNHTDHHGDALDVIDNFQIDKIFINAYDKKFSTNQEDSTIYENIIKKAIAKNIKVVGVSYGAIKSTTISPSLTNSFIQSTANAKESNFIEFNNNTTKNISFGSAKIQIFNWELFDKNGNQIYVKKTANKWEYKTEKGSTSTRETITNENNNSLGLLLTQGNKKAFFAGDINNNDKKAATSTSPERLGDEDRIKNAIGKIDLLKLGHHGNTQSSTQGFINVLNPKYAVISNEMGRAHKDITDWLKKDDVNYIYTTQDKYEVAATLTNNIVFFGLGTEQTINKINNEWKYIPKGTKYKNLETNYYDIEYKQKKVNVKSWDDLKTAINNNRNNEVSIDDNKKTYTVYELVVNLQNGGNWTANSKINIERNQKVVLTSSENVTIKRGSTLNNAPLFLVNGNLSLGTDGMKGTITLDGNKSNVTASATLINVDLGDLSLYNNVKLCNNFNKATTLTKKLGAVDYYVAFGSAIFARNSNIYMYGGEISNNSQKIAYELELPMQSSRNYYLSTMGAGVYLESASIFNMNGGSIINNKAANNSVVKTNSKYTNLTGDVKQQCLGVGVYADRSSEVNLKNGKIQNNKADNNSVIQLITPTVSGKTTTIKKIDNSIYGAGVYTGLAYLTMGNNFVISGNSATKGSNISLQKNTKIQSSATACIIGLQGCADGSVWTIDGGTISGGTIDGGKPNSYLNTSNKGAIGSNGTSSIFTINTGGGIQIGYGSKATINKLTISNCNSSDRGGGIYVTSSTATISNSSIINNHAIHGGGMFIANDTSKVNIVDSTFSNNQATASGGGIYTYGKITIKSSDKKNTIISNNKAKYAGGGICINAVGEVILNSGDITKNFAENTGGGIQANGKLTINGGKISENSAGTLGGGIRYFSGTLIKNGGTISNNTVNNEISNIYPINKKIVDDSENQNTEQEPVNQNTDQEPVNQNTDQQPVNQNTDQESVNQNTDQESGNQNTEQELGNQNTDQEPVNQNTDQELGNQNTEQELGNQNTDQEPVNQNTDQESGNQNTEQEPVNQNPNQEPENQYTSFNLLDYKIEGIVPTYYTGKNVELNISITKENIKLIKDVNYKLTYNNNKDIGEATVRIDGIGAFKGRITKTFKIIRKPNIDENKEYFITSVYSKGRAIDAKNGNLQADNNTVINTLSCSDSQKFKFIKNNDESYYIQNNVNNVSTKTKEDLGQKWYIGQNSDNTISFYTSDGLVIDLTGDKNNSNIKTSIVNNNSSQKFNLKSTSEISSINIDTNKYYYILSSINNKKAIDVYGGRTANFTNVDIYDLNRTNAQKFRFEKNSDGSYTILNKASNKALDVYANKTANMTNVDIYTSNKTNAQKWFILKNSDGTITFLGAESGKALDLYAANVKNFNNIEIWDWNQTNAQKWKLMQE